MAAHARLLRRLQQKYRQLLSVGAEDEAYKLVADARLPNGGVPVGPTVSKRVFMAFRPTDLG